MKKRFYRKVPGICTKILKIGKIFADVPLPAPDGGGPVCSGAFLPAVRSPMRMDWLSMTYGTCGAVWGVMCSMSRGGTWPAARSGGGRDGVLAFPVRGR
jgi:hypothetical protein